MRRLFPLVLALAFALTACGGPGVGSASSSAPPAPDDGQASIQQPVDIPFALAAYPEYSFHPALAENRSNLTLSPLLYEPLFQVDETFQAVPVLCQSHSASADKLVWTFTLRPNVTFSDGTPLTGKAVADALNLARKDDSRYARRLGDISSVTAVENTVTITLSHPNGSLPVLLDIPIALGDGDRPLGTGPYTLTGSNVAPKLTAREGWWQGKELPAQEILLRAADRSDDLISSFASGDVGLVDVDLMGTNALGYSGNYETWDYATTDFLYLGFNTQTGVCQDPAFRRAVAGAIDRTAIVQVDYARHAQTAALPVHPDSPLYDRDLVPAYDPAVLAAEVEGLRAKDRTLTLLVNQENPAKVAAAQRIANQLEAAGLQVILQRLPFEDYSAALTQGVFDLYLGEVVLTADFDLTALLSAAGPLNYGRWQDEQGDGLLSALRGAQGEERTAPSAALFSYLNEQAPIAPICFKNGSVLTQWGRLLGLDPVRGNVFYRLDQWSIQ